MDCIPTAAEPKWFPKARRALAAGKTRAQAAKAAGVTERRLYQVLRQVAEDREIPRPIRGRS